MHSDAPRIRTAHATAGAERGPMGGSHWSSTIAGPVRSDSADAGDEITCSTPPAVPQADPQPGGFGRSSTALPTIDHAGWVVNEDVRGVGWERGRGARWRLISYAAG